MKVQSHSNLDKYNKVKKIRTKKQIFNRSNSRKTSHDKLNITQANITLKLDILTRYSVQNNINNTPESENNNEYGNSMEYRTRGQKIINAKNVQTLHKSENILNNIPK